MFIYILKQRRDVKMNQHHIVKNENVETLLNLD